MKTRTPPRLHERPATVTSIRGIALGEVVGVDAQGAFVDYPGNPAGSPLLAVSTVALMPADVGRAVALGFASADPTRPIVLGFVWHPDGADAAAGREEPARPGAPLDVRADGERVVIEADREITLRCGKASITLTRAGRILLRGTYLLSRSSGANRIKGGSVQIN